MFGSPVRAALLAAFAAAACAQTAADLAEAGGRLSASQAREVAAQVDADPENLDARVELASYYWREGLGKPWQAQVLWMIEHHPESALLQTRIMWMPPAGVDGTAVRAAWLRQVDRKPSYPVIDNAFRALVVADFTAAEDLLKRARKRDPTLLLTRLLAQLCTAALVPSYRRWHMARPELVTPEITAAVRREVENTEDAALAETMYRLITFERPDDPDGFGKRLLARAEALDPDGRLRRQSNPPLHHIRIGVSAQDARLIKRVAPVYPPHTESRGIVRLRLWIGPDGRVTDSTPVAGPPSLVGAAMDAVAQWVFRPARVNGEPVDSESEVDVAVPAR